MPPFTPPPRCFGAIFDKTLTSLWIFGPSINSSSEDTVFCALGKLYPSSYDEFIAIREAIRRRESVLNHRKITSSRDALEDEEILLLKETGHVMGWEKNYENYGLAADVTDVSNEMVSVSLLEEEGGLGGGAGGGFDEQVRKRQEERLESEEIEDCQDIKQISIAIKERGKLRIDAIQSIAKKAIDDTSGGEGEGDVASSKWSSPLIKQVQLHPFIGISLINEELIDKEKLSSSLSSSSSSLSSTTYLGSPRDEQIWKAVNEAFKIINHDNHYNLDEDLFLYWKNSPLGNRFLNHIGKYLRIQGLTSSELQLRMMASNRLFDKKICDEEEEEDEEDKKLLYALGRLLSNQLRSASFDLLAVDIEKIVYDALTKKEKSLCFLPPQQSCTIEVTTMSKIISPSSYSGLLPIVCYLCELPIKGIAAVCRRGCGRVWHLMHGMDNTDTEGIECIECREEEEDRSG
jgi:hypothetical protein